MTTTEDTLSVDPSVRRQPVALCVLVGVLIVVGWVLYRHYVSRHAISVVFRWHTLGRWLSVAELVNALILAAPYALALLLWGRSLPRSLWGAAVALAAGGYVAALGYGFERWVFDPHGVSASSVSADEWLQLLGLAVLVPLAWGLARREGRAWPLGLAIGPVVAAAMHQLQHSTWWEQHVGFDGGGHDWMYQAIVFVAPFVLAVLACWAIEAGGRSTPEIGSSA